jgi:hypothetical protein
VLTVDFTLFALLFAISLARSREPDDLVPDDPAQ